MVKNKKRTKMEEGWSTKRRKTTDATLSLLSTSTASLDVGHASDAQMDNGDIHCTDRGDRAASMEAAPYLVDHNYIPSSSSEDGTAPQGMTAVPGVAASGGKAAPPGMTTVPGVAASRGKGAPMDEGVLPGVSVLVKGRHSPAAPAIIVVSPPVRYRPVGNLSGSQHPGVHETAVTSKGSPSASAANTLTKISKGVSQSSTSCLKGISKQTTKATASTTITHGSKAASRIKFKIGPKSYTIINPPGTSKQASNAAIGTSPSQTSNAVNMGASSLVPKISLKKTPAEPSKQASKRTKAKEDSESASMARGSSTGKHTAAGKKRATGKGRSDTGNNKQATDFSTRKMQASVSKMGKVSGSLPAASQISSTATSPASDISQANGVTPVQQPKLSRKESAARRQDFNEKLFGFLNSSCYRIFTNRLYLHRKPFQKQVQRIAIKEMVAEIRRLVYPATRSVWDNRGRPLEKAIGFSWDAADQEAKRQCPMLYSAISTALLTKGGRAKRPTAPTRKHTHTKALIFGLLSSACGRRPLNVLQEIISLELWLGGCSKKVMRRLFHLGLCLEPDTLKKRISGFLRANEIDIRGKMQQVEYACKASQTESIDDQSKPVVRSMDITVSDGQEDPRMHDRDLEEADKVLASMETVTKVAPMDTDGEKKDAETSPSNETVTSERQMLADHELGYSLALGDVTSFTKTQLSGIPRMEERSGPPDERGTMVQACVTVDRIPSMHLGEQPLGKVDPKKFKPVYSDKLKLWKEYVVMVERILCRRMPCFKVCSEEVVEHINHNYSKESEKKSCMIPLGITHKVNTKNKLEEMVEIMETLHKYVPSTPDLNYPVRTILGGKSTSCERARAAQRMRASRDSKWDRLEGLCLPVQEWEKHGAYVQDTYKLLYDAKSAHSIGSLAYIKDRYPSNDFVVTILQSTQHAADLLRFATEVYVVAAACAVMSLDDPSGTTKRIANIGKTKSKIKKCLQSVAESIVHMVFQPRIVEDVEEEGVFCLCRTDIEDELMVRCDNKSCKRGTWFHLPCLGLHPDDVPDGDWYCCEECSQNCDKGDIKSEWDHVHEYSRAILYRGLGEMVRNDAVCENDAHRMLTHWKYDMVDFFRSGQSEMFAEGFSLLVALFGGASPRMAHQLQWNRTVNPSGGAGQNVPLDRYMEKMSQELEDAVRCASATYMFPNAAMRVSRALVLRRDLEDNLDSSLRGKQEEPTQKKMVVDKDIMDLAKRLLDHKCLDVVPGRFHKGFRTFKARTHLNDSQDIDDYLDEINRRCSAWRASDML